MSKYLVKILSICALIVLMAVTIVGAAIGVAEAVGVTLTVIDTTSTGSTESNVKIYVNDKEQTENKITVAKYTEVKLVFTGADKGYPEVAWYQGESVDATKAKALSTELEYKFDLDKTMTISAVATLKTYTVTFTGKMPDGVTDVTKPITEGGAGLGENVTYTYGQTLPVIPGTDTVRFDGWKINAQEGTENATVYTTATFDTTIVTLTPAYTSQELTEYTLKVRKSVKDSTEIASLTFNKNNPAVFNPKREGYTLKGIMYNDKLYAYDSASHTIPTLYQDVATGTETTIDTYAVWECDYAPISLSVVGSVYAFDPVDNVNTWLRVYADGKPINATNNTFILRFVDGIEEGDVDLQDNIFDLVGLNEVTEFATDDGRVVKFNGNISFDIIGNSNLPNDVANILISATEPYTYTYANLVKKLQDYITENVAITMTLEFELA